MFIDLVLEFVCNQFSRKNQDPDDESDAENIIFTDFEVEVKMFGKTVRPDYVIMRRGMTGSEVEKPLYVVEVKRT